MNYCETEQDRRREDQAAEMVEKAWAVSAPRFPVGARIDRALVRGKQVVGYAEIRCKKIGSTRIPDVWLSTRKAAEMSRLKDMQKVLVFFIAKFSDGRIGAVEVGNVWTHPTTRIKKHNPRAGVAHEEEDAFAVPLTALVWIGQDPAPDFKVEEDVKPTPATATTPAETTTSKGEDKTMTPNTTIPDFYLPQETMLFQWMANREGGQKYGNQEIVMPVTREIYDRFILPKLGKDTGPFESYSSRSVRLIRKADNNKWFLIKIDSSYESLNHSRHPQWVIQVPSFDCPEALSHGSMFDSDIQTAPPTAERRNTQYDRLKSWSLAVSYHNEALKVTT